MSDRGLGFGGFLVGLGAGWYLFRYIDFSFDILSYLLILIGVSMILGGFLNRGRRENPISGALGGVIGGLFLALFITQGFSIVTNFTDFDNFSPGDYRASDALSLDTPLTSESIDLIIDSVNGGIDVHSWSGDTVKLDIEVKAKGRTDAQAEDRIADFTYDLSSEVSGMVQEISLSFPIPSSEWSNYAVLIDVYVPSTVSVDYDLTTTNGEITLTDITGESITLQTTNGAITLSDLEALVLQADTTNGVIRGTITTPESRLSTTNGGIDITIGKMSGEHILSTTNGGIDITASTDSDIGYRINLDTSIGAVDASLPNMYYSVDQTRTKIGETTGYSGKPVQIEINADTTIGGIDLN